MNTSDNQKQPSNQATQHSIAFVIKKDTLAKMQYFYRDELQENKNPSILLFAKAMACTISVYTTMKALFQGPRAEEEARIWMEMEGNSIQPSTKEKKQKENPRPSTNKPNATQAFYAHGGSDEVGTGDYFGPVCVCACSIDEDQYATIAHLPIHDSKQMNDAIILEVAPQLMELLPHSLLVLDNKTYNQVHLSTNMNAIKAKLHNQAYVHLQRKIGNLPSFCVIDQFTPEASYYRYLQFEPNVIRPLHFETKAESKYLAVACASMIARYAFLRAMQSMEDAYDMPFPKGAAAHVDQAARNFVVRYGKEQLGNVAKIHFANTNKLFPEEPPQLF